VGADAECHEPKRSMSRAWPAKPFRGRAGETPLQRPRSGRVTNWWRMNDDTPHSVDGSYLLGPFYDLDRLEISPAAFERRMSRLSDLWAPIRWQQRPKHRRPRGRDHCRRHDRFHSGRLEPGFRPCPPRAKFPSRLPKRNFAAGRLAEELVLTKLALASELHGSVVQEVLLFSEAQERSLVSRASGVASNDLVFLLADGRKFLIESKAAFRGHATCAARSARRRRRSVRPWS